MNAANAAARAERRCRATTCTSSLGESNRNSEPSTKRDEPADADDAEGRQERLGHEQRDAEQRSARAPAVFTGQHLQRRQREQQADAAHHAGEAHARMRELDVEAEEPGQHEEVGDVRVGEHGEHALREPHLVVVDASAPSAARCRASSFALLAADLDLAALDPREQLVEVARDEIHDLRASPPPRP